MTEKLYYKNSYQYAFHAVVCACTPCDAGFLCVLDRTAFFPEGGGQGCDTGYIGNCRVSDVQEKEGIVFHTVQRALPVGLRVFCRIDAKQRFRRMQNHTGEHVFSGTAHRLFGLDNVGFHMTDECMTIDLNGSLTAEQLAQCETLCNEIIYQNRTVTTSFPSADELAALDYRAKLALTENVRLVHIEDCDLCACCAPHVARTGEVGLLKITDFMSHRGGVRITLLCGEDAYRDYCRHFQCNRRVSAQLSARAFETPEAVEKLLADVAALKKRITELTEKCNQSLVDALPSSDGNLCIFTTDCDTEALRGIANRGLPKCGKCFGAFSGTDENGYSYCIASAHFDLRGIAKAMNAALNGRGGGRPEMIQGSFQATREQIEAYFTQL